MSDESQGKRVVLKLSGEALMGETGYGIDHKILSRVVGEIAEAKNSTGVQIAVVLGGGNICRGVSLNADGMDRVTADVMGMLATTINCLAISDAFRQINVPNRVLTAGEMKKAAETYYRDRALTHLEAGEILLLAGGTGSPFFTTDTAAALRAAEIGADRLFKATKVDGLYNTDPVLDPNARFLPKLGYDEVLGNRLDVMDATAVSLCRDNNIPIVVFNMTKPGNILLALKGASIGSVIGDGDD
jgi:uridylate kinase